MDELPFIEDDIAEEIHQKQRERDRRREERIRTGVDDRIELDAETAEVAATVAEIGNADDDEMTMEEREAKWGFSLSELQSATKVVSRLFQNPSLFVGDPHLADSRLYTMISRDRKTRRENKDDLKRIQNQERSRREKAKREADIATIKKTGMKKERDAALNALLIKPNEEDETKMILESPVMDAPPMVEPVASQSDPSSPVPAVTDGSEKAVAVADAAMQQTANDLALCFYIAKFVDSFERNADELRWLHYSLGVARYFRVFPHAYGTTMPCPLLPENMFQTKTRHLLMGQSSDNSSSPASPTAAAAMRFVPDALLQAQQKGGTPMLFRHAKDDVEEVQLPPLLKADREDASALPATLPWAIGEVVYVAASMDRVSKALEHIVGLDRKKLPAAKVNLSLVTNAAEALFDLREAVDRDATASAEVAAQKLFTILPMKGKIDLAEVVSKKGVADLEKRVGALVDLTIYAAFPADLFIEDTPDIDDLVPEPKQEVEDDDNRRNNKSRKVRDEEEAEEAAKAFREAEKMPRRLKPLFCAKLLQSIAFKVVGRLKRGVGTQNADEAYRMNRMQKCHICKRKYHELHGFYYSLCPACGEYNYDKRMMTRDLRGKVVLLTGARIKIGYAMALSLLRCGAELIATTRFAHDCLARFMEEEDYEEWQHRLHVYSLDLRDMWVVHEFCAFVTQRFPKLFAIINNAAQTIARTAEYTAALRQQEVTPAPQLRDKLMEQAGGQTAEWYGFFLRNSSVTVGQSLQLEYHPGTEQRPFEHTIQDRPATAPAGQPSATPAAAATPSAAAATEDEVKVIPILKQAKDGFVYDRYDTQAEESDTRSTNSWTMNMAEVHGSEAAEVMTINALSPFVLNSRLKKCLLNREGDAVPNEKRFIINVSAMEGQFYRHKLTTHPHTNMAKAALNMMTRTSADDYVSDGIYMNSVDTGWITDESPMEKKQRRNEEFMLCPLDEVDAAARCLDLIYTDSTEHGKFYKDFRVIPW